MVELTVAVATPALQDAARQGSCLLLPAPDGASVAPVGQEYEIGKYSTAFLTSNQIAKFWFGMYLPGDWRVFFSFSKAKFL